MEADQFGLHLRSLRKRRKLTIRQLELYSGVSNGYLSNLENGKRGLPSPGILEKLHKHLGVSYNELMQTAGYVNFEDEAVSDDVKKAIDVVNYIVEKYKLDLSDPETIKLFESSAEYTAFMKRKGGDE